MNIKDDEICVEVDGDDWLPNSNVLGTLAEIYSDPNVWMTSGSFKYHDGRPGFAQEPHSFNQVRTLTFTLSHMRTWRSWLWKKIDPEDLKDENGEYWLFGTTRGLQIAEGGYASGTASTDMSGYVITLTGEEKYDVYKIEASAIAGLIA
jgi:hypothetical protein